MKTKILVKTALLAAVYTVISIALAPISFNSVQVRISEAFTLLPLLSPFAIIGVSLGCFLTNIIGLFMGANILGALDIFFGTAATLIAAVLTYLLRKKSIWIAALPPVIINAIVIGAELAFVIEGGFWAVFSVQALLVGAGQLIACYALGVPLIMYLRKNTTLSGKLFE